MTDEIDLKAARRVASKEAAEAAQKRESSIRNHRDAVRAFHPQILAVSKAERSWKKAAEALERWCGRKIPPNTVKTYTTMVNMGHLPPWPDDEAQQPIRGARVGQVGASPHAPAKPNPSHIAGLPKPPGSHPQSTTRVKPDPE